MTYNIYLKEKLINLYSINQKIGKHSILDKDFEFLEKYFKDDIKPNIYSISQLLHDVIQDYKSNFFHKIKD